MNENKTLSELADASASIILEGTFTINDVTRSVTATMTRLINERINGQLEGRDETNQKHEGN